jgi:hypothetical protein
MTTFAVTNILRKKPKNLYNHALITCGPDQSDRRFRPGSSSNKAQSSGFDERKTAHVNHVE